MKVSVCLPTIRLERARACVDRCFETARDAGADLEIIAVVEGKKNFPVAESLLGSGSQVVYRARHHGPGYGWNEAARASTGDALVLAGDDLIFGEGWLSEALNSLQHLPNAQGMVGFNDGDPTPRTYFTHYLITRQRHRPDAG